MTALDLDAIQACTDAATPEPWKLWGMDVLADLDGTSDVNSAIPIATTFSHPQIPPRTFNAQFIANARTWVPALVARVRELEALLRDLRANHEPADGEWLCPEGPEPACEMCLDGGAHEGKVCYTCSDPENDMAIWPCSVARAINSALGSHGGPVDRTATASGRAEILAEWAELERTGPAT